MYECIHFGTSFSIRGCILGISRKELAVVYDTHIFVKASLCPLYVGAIFDSMNTPLPKLNYLTSWRVIYTRIWRNQVIGLYSSCGKMSFVWIDMCMKAIHVISV